MNRVLAACLAAILLPQVAAAEPIFGRWAIKPEGCKIEGDTTDTAPLTIDRTSLKWFVAQCRIGKMYKIGSALHIQARCTGEGERYTIPVKLDLVGVNRLAVTWDKSPVEAMTRCR